MFFRSPSTRIKKNGMRKSLKALNICKQTVARMDKFYYLLFSFQGTVQLFSVLVSSAYLAFFKVLSGDSSIIDK